MSNTCSQCGSPLEWTRDGAQVAERSVRRPEALESQLVDVMSFVTGMYRPKPGEPPVFSTTKLSEKLSAADAARVMAAFQTFVRVIRAQAVAADRCPTCQSPVDPIFFQDGRSAGIRSREASAAVLGAFQAFTSLEVTLKGQKIPFLSESLLYDLIWKDDARSVLSRVRDVAERAGIKEPWRVL